MKSKTLKKRLTLNKTTVADLNSNEMDSARGGTITLTIIGTLCTITCGTCPTLTCDSNGPLFCDPDPQSEYICSELQC